MIETNRINISVSLILLTITFILHLVAMNMNHWKIYEHRTKPNRTISIGIFRRCEILQVYITPTISTAHSTCNDNKYCFFGNKNCDTLKPVNSENEAEQINMQKFCNMNHNPYACDYSPVTKGLISCTIIAACTLGLSLILIFSHILINQFKYKIHMYITIITLILLFLGFLFILITLILFGATMKNDLYQYQYNLDYRLNSQQNDILKENLKMNVTKQAADDYDIRLNWAGGLEIIALILSSITLFIQIVYLFSTYRNRMG